MSDELRLAGYREPLGLWVRRGQRLDAEPQLRVQEFEFSSRGDRVSGWLLLPAQGGGPHPLVLLQTGSDDRRGPEALLAGIGSWVRGGVAVASLDFPLQGARADRKFLARLADPTDPDPGPARTALAIEFARQAVIDLERGLDALCAMEWVDAERIVYVGLRLGARIGAAFCALDPRPQAAVLALTGSAIGLAEIDPLRYIGRIAPRPLLFVGAERDASTPRAAAEALFAAAGSPKEQRWVEAPEHALDDAVLETLWRFVANQLGIGGIRGSA